ncbi:hypothetical protein HAX54_006177 [Datura stramonium]|uniref:Uncharacterized protein n=1 Tax=Datura stramonium TaxID=4076 RepID=A0ABS8TB49_DATST|nr:hypothetical protein [Datura stramonium]
MNEGQPIGDTPIMSNEFPVEPWVRVHGYRLPRNSVSSVIRDSRAAIRRRNSKGKAPMTNTATQTLPSDEAQRIAHIQFRLARMEKYYVSFNEKRSIHEETQLEVESLKNDFPDVYY